MGGKTSKRRHEILEAALACFNRRGVAGTTIADIRDRSGASTGSIYHHFGSKAEIALALIVEGLEDHTRRLERRLADSTGPREGIRTMVETLAEWVAENPERARFIYDASGASGGSRYREALDETSRNHRRVIVDYFAPHMEEGAFRTIPEDCFLPVVIGPVHDYARRWLADPDRADIRERVEVFAGSAWRAVGRGEP